MSKFVNVSYIFKGLYGLISDEGKSAYAAHTVQEWYHPLATSISAATSLLITPLALSDTLVTKGVIIAQPDFPRNLTVWCSAGNTSVVTIVGVDQFGTARTETISCNGAAIVAGVMIFSSITSVSSATRTGGATTLSIGQGSKLGCKHTLLAWPSNGMVDNVLETTAPTQDLTYSALTFNSALAPGSVYIAQYQTSDKR